MRSKIIAAGALVTGLTAMTSGTGLAADVVRKLIVEADPIAPSSAIYETQNDNVSTSKWGAGADFNLGGVMSTGPQFWTGNFWLKGPNDSSKTYRREDLWPGESEKLDAIRLRWMFTAWEQPASMRGWYLTAGYSYTRVNGRLNRIPQSTGQGDATPANIAGGSPDDNTSIVTDIRHGGVVGFGNRWLFSEQKFTASVGASFTANFKRTISIDGKDPNAAADYNQLIQSLPDTRIDTRPTPEIDMGVGYAW